MMPTIYKYPLQRPRVKAGLTNAPIPLNCGITVWADLRHKQWAKVASRGYHRPETESFLVSYLQPGDIAIDVGAHIGMLTAVMSKSVGQWGKVYAFEIDDENFSELESTIRRNRFKECVC